MKGGLFAQISFFICTSKPQITNNALVEYIEN